MRTVRERYLSDPVFYNLVETLRSCVQQAQLTPSEIREAATLACILEEERRPFRWPEDRKEER